MAKSKFYKTIVLGLCLSALSTGMIFANGDGAQSVANPGRLPIENKVEENQSGKIMEVPPDWGNMAVSYPADIDESILQKQREIDQYLFKENYEEINKKGFKVIYTGPHADYVEIGITPYTDENSQYLYNIFGEANVKVVEAMEATILPLDAIEPALYDGATELKIYSSEILDRQREIDKYLFVDNTEEVRNKGIEITHTGPYDYYVEIGITPYSEENADYLYEIFGREDIKVVEGQQAELFRTTTIADGVDLDISTTEDQEKSNSSKAPLLYSLGALSLLGGGYFISRRL